MSSTHACGSDANDPVALNRAIHAAVLEPDLAALEHGLDTLVGPRGGKLSGGQVMKAGRLVARGTADELLAKGAPMT